ncbi:molybdopterin-dependent oxidoreductase [Alkalimonas delamerensis]|uniref:Molybdopterin-dependent oxidoreductase n=1 Tax=Alkalimonas delamerensis TaxID=265981 RepID=A0ABT9GTF0_9GAMM|nr:molybdopterin-dependent oxidoreductase [Alkalimonas delamerensis]MDP4530255.1 molybdopterin-dependent oxidoreductase [Alkalimonas delamerensis]
MISLATSIHSNAASRSPIRASSWLMCLLLMVALPSWADSDIILLLRHAEEQHALTLKDLDKLPQQQARFQAAWGPEGQWQGVYLQDLLTQYQLNHFQDIRLNALNDYRIRLTTEEIHAGQPVLATRFNGQPIALEHNGPVILIWPRQAQAVLDGTAPLAPWIWSLAEIRVRP